MDKTISGNFSADGVSAELVVSSPSFEVMNGAHVWIGSGANVDFGDGTVSIEMKNAQGAWVAIPLATYLAPASEQVFAKNNSSIRLRMSDSTTPNLDYEISCMSSSK